MPLSPLYLFLIISYVLIVLSTIKKILLVVKTPSKTLSWILVIIFLPIIGIIFYTLLGRNIKKDKLFQQRKPFYNTNEVKLDIDKIPQKNHNIVKLLHKNNSASLSYNNKVTVLKDGAETFSALFDAMQKATSNIHLDFYIVEPGKIFDKLILILKERVENGVVVRFLFDKFGSSDLEEYHIELLHSIGVEVHEFMPFKILAYFDYINYRNHRKILIVDNKIAFTGGMNISDNYTKIDSAIGLWHDTYIKIEGPAAKDFEKIFEYDWFFAKGKPYSLTPNPEFLNDDHTSVVQVLASGPDTHYSGVLHEYFTLITDAEDYVYIVTPYFVPGEAILVALKTAALSGIDVRIMLPFISDSKWLKWCMFSFLEELLGAGVRIYLYHEGFLHSKVVICDDLVASVGTANVDIRSFDTNFEVNAVIYDKNTTLILKKHFFDDMNSCDELQLNTFSQRADRNNFMEGIARLTSPIL